MRRSTLFFLPLVAALAVLVTACGDDDDDTMPPDDMPTSESGSMGDMGDMGDNNGHDDASPVAGDARKIEVAATSFAFDPDEITVTAGEDIAIVLTSDDLLHDFTIDELDAHVAADGGETAEGGFRAEEPGRYTFYCTVAGHREAGMEGTLIVAAP